MRAPHMVSLTRVDLGSKLGLKLNQQDLLNLLQ